MSINWDLPGRSQRKDAASSASAGTFLAIHSPKTQHHQHQLGPFPAVHSEKTQHHEHQLGRSWPFTPQRLSILSISRHLPSRSQPKDAASSASVGTFLAIHSPKTQHQEHQLGPSWLCTARRRSVVGISWDLFTAQRRSIMTFLAIHRPKTPHHEHQLGLSKPFTSQRRSIISISWDLPGRSLLKDAGIIMSISWDLPSRSQPEDAASCASAGTFLAVHSPKTHHHEHRPGRSQPFIAQTRSIMSISSDLPGRSQTKA